MINPFENDSQSMQIGELIIENQMDKISIYGDIDITKDKKGLEHIKQLHELTSTILDSLQNLADLPEDQSQEPSEAKESLIDNPFL